MLTEMQTPHWRQLCEMDRRVDRIQIGPTLHRHLERIFTGSGVTGKMFGIPVQIVSTLICLLLRKYCELWDKAWVNISVEQSCEGGTP
jgi:hypothetical protein